MDYFGYCNKCEEKGDEELENKTYDLLKKCLSKLKIKAEPLENRAFCAVINSEDTDVELYVCVDDITKKILFVSGLPQNAGLCNLPTLCSILNEVNTGINDGCFYYDDLSKLITYKHSMSFLGEPSESDVCYFIALGITYVVDYSGLLCDYVAGVITYEECVRYLREEINPEAQPFGEYN